MPLSCEHDCDATADSENDDVIPDFFDDDADVMDGVLSAIEKVCTLQS
jgi:hypothetical protein